MFLALKNALLWLPRKIGLIEQETVAYLHDELAKIGVRLEAVKDAALNKVSAIESTIDHLAASRYDAIKESQKATVTAGGINAVVSFATNPPVPVSPPPPAAPVSQPSADVPATADQVGKVNA